jgi:single-stranded-DNA-specific exonuclease
VSAVEAIHTARRLGVDVVVLDHHQPPPVLPPALAIVNPWLPSSTYPFKDLAGVGVTFKFVWALAQRFSRQTKLSAEFRQFLVDSLGLVALGTISDVVPLLGENRVFARFGLAFLMETPRPGLRELVRIAVGDRGDRRLDARHVGFRIGPVLNAAGRLGQADTGLELLLTRDDAEARRIASFLEGRNEERRAIERAICSEARTLVASTVDLQADRAIVLGAHGWHAGVIGIVASRITEEFFRPTVLVSFDGDRGRGSARSIPGVHISRALSDCEDCLLSHGGHEMAAGVEIFRERMDDLRLRLNRAIGLKPELMVPEIEADAAVTLRELTIESVGELARLEPHGAANPEPLFLVERAEVVGSPRIIGRNGEHLAFHVRQDGCVRRAVAFGKADLHAMLAAPGVRVSMLVVPELATWKSRTDVELKVRDLH